MEIGVEPSDSGSVKMVRDPIDTISIPMVTHIPLTYQGLVPYSLKKKNLIVNSDNIEIIMFTYQNLINK